MDLIRRAHCKLNQVLKVITNSRICFDDLDVRLLGGFHEQILCLGNFNSYVEVYCVGDKVALLSENVKCIPVFGSEDLFGLRQAAAQMSNIRKVICEVKKEDDLLIYYPDSYIGFIAVIFARLLGKNYLIRYTNNLYNDYCARRRKTNIGLIKLLFWNFEKLILNENRVLASGTSNNWPNKIISTNLEIKDFVDSDSLTYSGIQRILFVGRLDKYKNFDYFLKLSKYHPNKKFYAIVGGEDAIPNDNYPNLTCYNNLTFKEVLNKMRCVDLLIVPSIEEFQGKVHFEAASQGCLVALNDIEEFKSNFYGGALFFNYRTDDVIATAESMNHKVIMTIKKEGHRIAKKSTLDAYESKLKNYFHESI